MERGDPAVADGIAALAALGEPVRRALYEHVAASVAPVGRSEAAAAVGTTRENAAFHLDRLVEEGLLETSYRRLSGRSGPGAGRPAKLYRRSDREVTVSIPPRRYALLADLLSDALARAEGGDARAEATRVARAFGADLGRAARARAGRAASRRARLRAAAAVLAEHGFAPVEAPAGTLRLANCPFDETAKRHPGLVCGLNLSLIEGLLSGLAAAGIRARLDPAPGRCCVTLSAR